MAIYQSAKNILERVRDEDVLGKIKNVDGNGSGLDADLVRGYDMLTRNYVSPIDLSSATSDYNLATGEVAKIDFSSATNVPLHIATQDGTSYEMLILPSNTGGTTGGTASDIFLLPNNTTYSSAFYNVYISRSQSALGSSNANQDGFAIGSAISFSNVIIENKTNIKQTIAIVNYYGTTYGYAALMILASAWRDTTTTWTSLGTINFPQSTSGTILVRRLT